MQMKCALSGDAATLVWSKTKPEQLTVEQLQELLRENTVQLRRKKISKLNCVSVGGRQVKICQL